MATPKFKITSFGILLVMILMSSQNLVAQNDQDLADAAVLPLPTELRDGATVLRIAKTSELEVLRKGSNDMICLSDDPSDDRFHVACYHKSLDPWMARGRALKGEGMSKPEYDKVRENEIEAGTLAFPDSPASLYSLSGAKESYDYETEKLNGASPLYVVYLPYATESSTGLSTSAVAQGAPWIMNPGKPWAHIMIITGESRVTGEADGKED